MRPVTPEWAEFYERPLIVPPRWPVLEEVNEARIHWGLAPVPSDLELTELVLAQGFTTCLGRPYLRVVA